MSPLDDELRAALQSRASSVAASPDPLAGIERRARRMRRNRLAAAVAGSALAVAAVATAVPLLQGAASPPPVPRDLATTAPSASPSPSPTPTRSAFGLDPANPWAFRGTPVDEGTRATIQREYATRTRGGEVLVTPLFAQVYEPSQRLEVVFLAEVDGSYRWGVAQESESGPEFVWDQPLPDETLALAAALPGDEVARLLVVAAPEVGALEYGADDASEFTAMSELAPGVGVIGLEGDAATDSYRLLDPGGDLIQRAPAPDPAPGDGDADATRPKPADAPDNMLGWGFRGQEDPELEERAVQAYADSKGVSVADVGVDVLFSGDNDPGQRFTVLQMWTAGRPAQVVGFVDHPDRADELVLQPLTDPAEPVVALLLTGTPGRTVDELVVIPTPMTGQVMYAADAQAEARPVESAPGLDGVVLIDRAKDAEDDRLVLLDGNGDLDRPTYDGPVDALLCGEQGC